MNRHVVVIGAGPAGITAGMELVGDPDTRVTILEADSCVGGISRTVNYKGNRIDIGGHRFFSKSDWVMDWWQQILPVAAPEDPSAPRELRYQNSVREGMPSFGASEKDERVMLVRNRLSRIYYNKRFFDYPLKLNLASLLKLGPWKTFIFGLSYVWAHLRPIRPEQSLEDFMINRFGRRLYRQFFQEYTEKVWGVPCREISSAWGAQRIKSLSVMKALLHSARRMLGSQAQAEQTSLIESFLYPKYGPGQMWEVAAQHFVKKGGELHMHAKVDRIDIDGSGVRRVEFTDGAGNRRSLECTHLVSTMPIRDLVAASGGYFPADVQQVARGLSYRDFITVGLLYPRSSLRRELPDNWIYIQEPGVKVGRVQVFNNWSPYLVADPDNVWIGLEFFCVEGDDLWSLQDDDMKALGHREMVEIGLVGAGPPLDSVVIRVPKAYPGYFGPAFQQFEQIREALDAVPNLFLVGRNGMHRYNNQDHSMLTAREAASQIRSGEVDKAKIWAINVDDEYHEEVSSTKGHVPEQVPAPCNA